jgi:hypothetical protein
MPYELTPRVQKDVLTATGVRNLETVAAIAQELKSLCKEHGVVKVLVDVRGLEGRLPTLDTLLLVTRHFKTLRDLRVLRKAAVLDQNLTKKRHGFLEDLAFNRGYRFRIFEDLDEATEWLR